MGDYLVHYGIKGQSWGKRRFQNLDGSLTPAGERRYNYEQGADGGGSRPTREAYEARNRRESAYARAYTPAYQRARAQQRSVVQSVRTNYGTESRFGSRNQQAINAMRAQNRNNPGSEGANSYRQAYSPEESYRRGQNEAIERSRANRAIQKDQEDGRNRTDQTRVRQAQAKARNNLSVVRDQMRGQELTNKINQQRQDALDKGNANIENARSQEGYRRLRDAAGQNEAIATSRRNRAVRADQERGKARTDEQNRRNAIERWVSQKWDVVKEESTSNNNVHLNKRGGLPRVGASAFVRDLASAPQLAKGQQMVEKFLGIFKKSKSSGSR